MSCTVCGCPEGRWLRVKTVARQFACTPKRVRRMIKRGELHGVMFGGEWRVDHVALDDYVREYAVRFAPSERDAPPAEG
ncbi:MAG: helix-turn-helix domain-containing protein [Planctomycetota bacterium]